jgi:hypothetical protein
VLEAMCEITNLSSELIKENELNSIGAQYLMKGVDYLFWSRVESDSENLYKEISELNRKKKELDPTHHELQIWCADMFAVLWAAWRNGYKTNCHPNFDFSWGTSSEQDYFKMNIMHNAGVTDSNSGLFYKAEYMNKLPYLIAKEPNQNTASWHYWNYIQDVGRKSCLLQ